MDLAGAAVGDYNARLFALLSSETARLTRTGSNTGSATTRD